MSNALIIIGAFIYVIIGGILQYRFYYGLGNDGVLYIGIHGVLALVVYYLCELLLKKRLAVWLVVRVSEVAVLISVMIWIVIGYLGFANLAG